MSEPTASPVAASLARRLRGLRLSRFPDARLTQGEVAQALSEEEPVAISTVSAWENVRTPTLPSRTRLSTYARFFATERSLDRQKDRFAHTRDVGDEVRDQPACAVAGRRPLVLAEAFDGVRESVYLRLHELQPRRTFPGFRTYECPQCGAGNSCVE